MAAKNAENAKDLGLCPRPLKPLRPLRTLRLISTGRPLFSCLLPLLLCAFCAKAENAYTNHAGNVVSGVVVATFINGVGDIKLGIKAYSRQGN